MDTTHFIARRRRLGERMRDGIAVIPTAPERVRNADNHYAYRSDSYFQYLTGFGEPESILVVIADATASSSRSILFCRDKDQTKEIWDGFRWGPEAAREAFGFDEAYSINEFDSKFAELLANQPVLHHSLGHDAAWDARIATALNTVRAQARTGKWAPAEMRDIRSTIDEMRLFKDAAELATMRRAADLSSAAHCRAMRFARPGCNEYELDAELLHEFRRHGSQAPAYTSIVAGGANACVLHYSDNNQPLRDGDLVLIDAGCELDGYASDITRTFPVNGRFVGAQADVYALVLAAQAAAIAAIVPGATFASPHDAAVRALTQGMVDLKLLEGSVDAIIESESYKRFYMHRTGHWLGMDVHDVGMYKCGEQWRTLEPGMVITVEPGCYIRPGDDVPPAFWNIGVRIEDDVVITGTGSEVISDAAPKTIADIEALMRERRPG
jgi:Xaa-Pro aminopeptidase